MTEAEERVGRVEGHVGAARLDGCGAPRDLERQRSAPRRLAREHVEERPRVRAEVGDDRCGTRDDRLKDRGAVEIDVDDRGNDGSDGCHMLAHLVGEVERARVEEVLERRRADVEGSRDAQDRDIRFGRRIDGAVLGDDRRIDTFGARASARPGEPDDG